jgi:hypothetical protein
MNFEPWQFYAGSGLIGAIVGLLLRRRMVACAVAALPGWVILQLPSCIGMQAVDQSAAHASAEQFFWSLILLPGCALFGVVGALAANLISRTKEVGEQDE